MSRFIELDSRGYVWKDKVYQQLADEFIITGMTWEELLRDYINEFQNHCVPFPNLVEMLEALNRRNLKLGIITNGKGQFQMDNIKALGIEKYFDAILVSEWEGIKKPDQQIFNRALGRLNVLPSESIFLGDHPINDVEAAKNAGMIGIWKKDVQWSAVEADFIIDDLAEVPLIIDKHRGRTAFLGSKIAECKWEVDTPGKRSPDGEREWNFNNQVVQWECDKMKQRVIGALGYVTTGIGTYHIFLGEANFYSFIILIIGLLGVLYDVFYNKLNTEK